MRTMVQISHLGLLKSVCSLHILKYVSVAVMLKLLKKGKVNDWDDSWSKKERCSLWEFKPERDLEACIFFSRVGGKEVQMNKYFCEVLWNTSCYV